MTLAQFLKLLIDRLQDHIDVDDRIELLSLAEAQLIDEEVRLEEAERRRKAVFDKPFAPQRRKVN
jgi:hypothetical protein